MWIDEYMTKYPEYMEINKDKPIERIAWLLMKLYSDHQHNTDHYVSKFTYNIEEAFKTLPKPVKWISFYTNDLKNFLKMDDEVLELASELKLNKSQAEEVQKFKDELPEEYKEIVENGFRA